CTAPRRMLAPISRPSSLGCAPRSRPGVRRPARGRCRWALPISETNHSLQKSSLVDPGRIEHLSRHATETRAMKVLRIAAFCDGGGGGNPAGVVIGQQFPSEAEMRRVAAEVGFSETAFAVPAERGWRVRYFSPESEVPFCGHATIALGAALAL